MLEILRDRLVYFQETFGSIVTSQATWIQLAQIILIYFVAGVVARSITVRFKVFRERPQGLATTSRRMLLYRFGHMIFPLLAIIMLRISIDVFPLAGDVSWLLETAVKLALIILYVSFVKGFVHDRLVAKLMLYTGVFLLVLNALDILDEIASVLDVMALQLGNIRISMLGILRVTIFGSFIFWLGRVSSNTGQEMIRKQESLDFRTREVAAKLFDIVIFTVVFILLLQVMGINLTALAVFGGAVGVGLGFGLQSIASNFISGIIILLDRSLSIGDYVELEDGRAGHVTSLNMRSTTLETFDGKDIMVPNEMFISSTFINWTHKNKKQRYRVDFSVAYDSDIRRLVDIIKVAVAQHPQVLSGPAYSFEEQPDCEIDGFGDSGVNMFVEFWMEAIDDGKNRVGGDLMLIIYEAMRDNGFTIPFPQREVRML